MELAKTQRTELVEEIQRYFQDELAVELGQFDSEFLIDFLAKKMGVLYYNQGIHDAQKLIEARAYQLTESLYELEKVVD